MANDAIRRLALAIQQGQGNGPPQQPMGAGMTPVRVAPMNLAPMNIPNFQIPGMNTMADPNTRPLPTIQRGPSTQVPPQAPAMPPMPAPTPISMPPGMQAPAQPAPLDPSVMPSTSSIDNRLAPAGNQLDQWRQALDAMQFGRQGQ